jgi:hypothetical protein
MRRKIGSAYELSPAELTSRWLNDNLIRVFGATVAVILFCLAVDWLSGSLLNFLANNGDDTAKRVIATNDPVVIGVKLTGSAILAWFLLFRLRMSQSGG